MDSLITTASSTFATTFGFGIGSVIDTGVSFLKLGVGTGLAYFTAILPVLLGIALVYGVYRIAKLGWAHLVH